MSDQTSSDKIPLTLQLPAAVAARLKSTSETRHRPAAELAIELLDRYLPRLPTAGSKPGGIPYS
jgi:hypothetical protein